MTVEQPKSPLFRLIYDELLDKPFLDIPGTVSLANLIVARDQAIDRLRDAGVYSPVSGPHDYMKCGSRPVGGRFCRRRLCPFCWARQSVADLRRAAKLVSNVRPAVIFYHERRMTVDDARLAAYTLTETLDRIHARLNYCDDSLAQLDYTPLPDGLVLQRAIGLAVQTYYRTLDLGTDGLPSLPGTLRMIGTPDGVQLFVPYLVARCDWVRVDTRHVANVLALFKDKTLRSMRGAFRKSLKETETTRRPRRDPSAVRPDPNDTTFNDPGDLIQ